MTRASKSVALVTIAVIGLGLAVPLVLADAARGRKQMIRATMPGVVMVLAVESKGGRLKAVSGGSGTVVAADGSILTNHHVIYDLEHKKLHEMFVIGRFRAADRAPELVCAGHPSRGRLKPSVDLALIKCDLDMNMRPKAPKGWPAVPVGRSEDIVPGEQILVLGYPGVGGSTIQVTEGLLSGWMSEGSGDATLRRAYMKTDADITNGNSGGAAIDESGLLIGVPTAYRVTTAQQGEVVVTAGKVGLIRPIEHARDLLAVAAAGWTPTEGPGTIDQPQPAAPPASGVTVTSKVVDASSRRPVSGAVVVVFKAGIAADDVDLAHVDGQALSWGQTNGNGVFILARPVPRGGRYTVAVIAPGYRPLVVDGALAVPADAPSRLDPWGLVRIERR